MKKPYWDEFNDMVQQHRLPENIKKLKLNETVCSSDQSNTKSIKRVKGGLEVTVCLRGGMPVYAIGFGGASIVHKENGNTLPCKSGNSTKIFGHVRRSQMFVAVPDSEFANHEPVNDYFEDTTKTLEGDDIINIKAEEVKEDADRKIRESGEEPKALGPG